MPEPPSMTKIYEDDWGPGDVPMLTLLFDEPWNCVTPLPAFYEEVIAGQGAARVGLRIISKPPVVKVVSGLIFSEPWSE